MDATQYTLIIKGLQIIGNQTASLIIAHRTAIIKAKELAEADRQELLAEIDSIQDRLKNLKYPDGET